MEINCRLHWIIRETKSGGKNKTFAITRHAHWLRVGCGNEKDTANKMQYNESWINIGKEKWERKSWE